MRDGHKKGKLYGIGIGPGDPGLLTLKGKEIIDRVDTVFLPVGREDGASYARSIIETATSRPKAFIEVSFPMTRDKKVLEKHWHRAAKGIAREVEKGKDVAFITLGDPMIYSTYIYLFETLHRDFPHIEVETIPGISAVNAAASRMQLPLVQGDERMAILPVTEDLKGLKETLEQFDTVVLMKVGSKLDRVVALLKEADLLRHSALVSHVGQQDEKMTTDLSSLKIGTKTGYLSVVIVKNPKKESLTPTRRGDPGLSPLPKRLCRKSAHGSTGSPRTDQDTLKIK